MNENELNYNLDSKHESEKSTNYNIWYIDDDESNLKAYQRLAKAHEFNLIGFQYASEAVKDIKDFLKENKSHLLPGYIVVDFTLDQKVDEKNYRTGDKLINTIKELFKLYNTDLPVIIGASGNEDCNKVLLEAGANMTYEKTELSKLFIDLNKKRANERNRGDQGEN